MNWRKHRRLRYNKHRFPKDIDKKHYILEKISKHEPNVKWIYDKNGKIKKESYDLSDSVCVGYSKLIQKGIVKPY